VRPFEEARQVANFLSSPEFEASCDGTAIRILPRPNVHWAPLASPNLRPLCQNLLIINKIEKQGKSVKHEKSP